MNETVRTNLDNLWSKDREVQNRAFFYILEVTDKAVDWAYNAWDEVVENLNALSLRGIACRPCGKSGRRERNNKSFWWTGSKGALESASENPPRPPLIRGEKNPANRRTLSRLPWRRIPPDPP